MIERALGERGRPDHVPRGQGRLGPELARRRHQALNGGAVGLDPRRVLLLGEQRPSPERQRGRRGRPSEPKAPGRRAPPRLLDEVGQRVKVEPVDDERVAGVGSRQAVGTEDTAQAAHQHAQLLGRATRCVVRPEAVDERVGRDRPAARQREHLQQPARLAAPEDGRVDPFYLQSPEHAHPQRTHSKIIPR